MIKAQKQEECKYMERRIIQIDEEKCNGCGACANACHEGAISMVNGKAHLMRDDYCDGLGDCLPTCPTGAIRFVVREAAAYDEDAVQQNMRRKQMQSNPQNTAGCPGVAAQSLMKQPQPQAASAKERMDTASCLAQWPVQIKLAPIQAPYFEGAELLIAADCTAFAYAAFHEDFMKGRVTLVGCPKLDGVDYSEKLAQILAQNNIRSVTLVRMEVPCCGGLENAARLALQKSGKRLPWQVVTLSIRGEVLI